MNLNELERKIKKISETKFNSSCFIESFISAFGVPKSLVCQIMDSGNSLSDIDGAVIWRNNLHVKIAEAGCVSFEMHNLEKSECSARYKCRYIVVTDGFEFSSRDNISGNSLNCELQDLHKNFHYFLPLAGIFNEVDELNTPLDLKVAKRLTSFFKSILKHNRCLLTEASDNKLIKFINKIIFCLFAEDIGIIPKNDFTNSILIYSGGNPQDVQKVIQSYFEAFSLEDTHLDRKTLPQFAQNIPFVGSVIFDNEPFVPDLSKNCIRYLLDAGALDWKDIKPDIFGSLIQSLLDYKNGDLQKFQFTPSNSIKKLLKPAFLEKLNEEFEASRNTIARLQKLRKKIAHLYFLDPACGCGNFLVVAYQELNKLEFKIIQRLLELCPHEVNTELTIKTSNFLGIEKSAFSARTAPLLAWIAECQIRNNAGLEFGMPKPMVPLSDGIKVRVGNALKCRWEEFFPGISDAGSNLFVIGNPPYAGSNKQTDSEKADMQFVFEKHLKTFKALDYACAWIFKAANFVSASQSFYFVLTNSVCQGVHVEHLWSLLEKKGLYINFAETSFKWTSERGKGPGVTVIILGCSKQNQKNKIFMSNNHKSVVSSISPYLTTGRYTIVKKSMKPQNGLPEMLKGNQATDGGHLILTKAERDTLLDKDLSAKKFIKKFVGSEELINSSHRYCLFIKDEDLAEACKNTEIKARIKSVRSYREKGSVKSDSLKLIETPWKMRSQISADKMLGIPIVFSERRQFMVPVELNSDYVVSNLAFCIPNPEPHLLSILSSRMLLVWVRAVCGQLETRIRFSNTMGWNTFPLPKIRDTEVTKISHCAENILLARDKYFDCSISKLYDPDNMKREYPELHGAHEKNDLVLEQVYFSKQFADDRERLEHLFDLYENLGDENT